MPPRCVVVKQEEFDDEDLQQYFDSNLRPEEEAPDEEVPDPYRLQYDEEVAEASSAMPVKVEEVLASLAEVVDIPDEDEAEQMVKAEQTVKEKPVKAEDDDEAEQVVKDEEAEVKDEEADTKAEAEAMRAFKLSARGSTRRPYNAATVSSQSMPEPSSAASSSSQSRPKPSSAPTTSEMTRSARDRAMKKASANAEGIYKHKTQKGIEQRNRRIERGKYEAVGLEVPAEFAKREATPSRQEQQSKAKNNMGIKFGPFGPPVEYGPRPPAFPPPPAPQTSSSSSAPVQIHTHYGSHVQQAQQEQRWWHVQQEQMCAPLPPPPPCPPPPTTSSSSAPVQTDTHYGSHVQEAVQELWSQQQQQMWSHVQQAVQEGMRSHVQQQQPQIIIMPQPAPQNAPALQPQFVMLPQAAPLVAPLNAPEDLRTPVSPVESPRHLAVTPAEPPRHLAVTPRGSVAAAPTPPWRQDRPMPKAWD